MAILFPMLLFNFNATIDFFGRKYISLLAVSSNEPTEFVGVTLIAP